MKICSVTIWYNPNKECVNNLLSYSSRMGKNYIIDNSNINNSELLCGMNNTIYIPNMNNLGIAKALNQGLEKALSDGYEWCMTMDQDSCWDAVQLNRYLEAMYNNISQKNISFAPTLLHSEIAKSGLSQIYRFFFPKKITSEICFPNRVITSGNIININVWHKIGRFYEPLFIDDVDSEFCFRLRKNDFSIIQFNSIFMSHELGHPRKTILPIHDFHKGIRLYYMIRNILWVMDKYPEYTAQEKYKKMYRGLWFDKLIKFDFISLKYMRRGKSDYKKNQMGKIKL